MKSYKYGIIGSFVFGKETYGGQSIKTRNFANELSKFFGDNKIMRVDTYGWKKHPFRLIFGVLKALSKCEEIVILPADRGVLVIPKLVRLLRGFRKNKLKYVVVGGWLPECLLNHNSLARCLKKFDGIYAETQTVKNALELQGFRNIFVLPNFKNINVLKENELVYGAKEPYKLCTFSRVLKEKGIEDAVNAVKNVNQALGRTAYTLDIYGRVDPNYEEEFAIFSKEFPEYISYKGAADGSKSTEILKDYFALLFPTRYFTEGVPGTILDAYAAGIPCIASKWESFGDVVDDGRSGIGYDFKEEDGLEKVLLRVAAEPEILNNMKKYCLEKANDFLPKTLIQTFINQKEVL